MFRFFTTTTIFVDKTVSTMLNKGRGIHCTFDGNFDVCFRQDELNDTTNWNLSNVRMQLFIFIKHGIKGCIFIVKNSSSEVKSLDNKQ